MYTVEGGREGGREGDREEGRKEGGEGGCEGGRDGQREGGREQTEGGRREEEKKGETSTQEANHSRPTQSDMHASSTLTFLLWSVILSTLVGPSDRTSTVSIPLPGECL